MKSLRYLVGASAALLLSACGLFEADTSQKPVPLPDFKPSVRLVAERETHLESSGRLFFEPVVIGSNIAAAGSSQMLLWHPGHGIAKPLPVKGGLTAGVDGNEQMVFVANRRGAVQALSMNGEPRWSRELGAEIFTRPRLAGDTLLVRSQDGRLLALSAATGDIRWQSDSKTPSLVVRAPAGMAVADGVVYAGFPGGRLRAYDVATGAMQWEAVVAQAKGSSEIERVTDVLGTPWLEDRQVCAAAFQGRVGCFDRQTGTARWTRELSSASGLTGDHRALYVTDDQSRLLALDKDSGRTLWKSESLLGRRLTRPQVFGRYLVVGDFQGYVHLFASETGQPAARLRVASELADDIIAHAHTDFGVVVSPVVVDERLVVQTADGKLTLLAIKDLAQ